MTDLRKQILDASAALVAEKGVRGVSIREVARRAKVSHQAPYHHFGDQSGLMREIAREGFLGLTEAMNRAAARASVEGGNELDELLATGSAYVRFARENPGHHRVMFQNALVDLHCDARPLIEAEQTFETLLRHADKARLAGFCRGLSTERVSVLCWSMVHGLATLLVEGALGPRGRQDNPGEEEIMMAALEDLKTLLNG